MNIILYSTGCPRCTVLEKKLNNSNISYQINNSIEQMTALGIINVPVLSIDGQLLNFKEAVDWINNKGD